MIGRVGPALLRILVASNQNKVVVRNFLPPAQLNNVAPQGTRRNLQLDRIPGKVLAKVEIKFCVLAWTLC